MQADEYTRERGDTVMASQSDLDLALRLVKQLRCSQSQGSLVSQAIDCNPIIEALGYYDLADFLRGTYTTTPENVECRTCHGKGSLGGNFGPTAWRRCPDCTPENVECPTCGGTRSVEKAKAERRKREADRTIRGGA